MNKENIYISINGLEMYSSKNFNWQIVDHVLLINVGDMSRMHSFVYNTITRNLILTDEHSKSKFYCKSIEEAEKIVYSFIKGMELEKDFRSTIYDKIYNIEESFKQVEEWLGE